MTESSFHKDVIVCCFATSVWKHGETLFMHIWILCMWSYI